MSRVKLAKFLNQGFVEDYQWIIFFARFDKYLYIGWEYYEENYSDRNLFLFYFINLIFIIN